MPYRTYPTADGELALAVGNDAQFVRLAELLGHPDWATDDRFARNRDRVANRDLLDALIRDIMLTRSRADWIAILDPAGIPSGPINSVAEALESQQTAGRGIVATVEHAAAGIQRMVGIPFRMFGTPATIRRPPPTLGEHTAEVLREELQLSDAAIAELAESGTTTVRTT